MGPRKKYAVSCLIIATVSVLGESTASLGQNANKKAVATKASRVSPIETVKHYLQRLGRPIDAERSKANLVVSSYIDEKKGKVDIVIAYDQKKDLVGFYIYDFGNTKQAPDAGAVRSYLLSANDQIAIGGFFVDPDHDIGYKYSIPSQQLSLGGFQSIYITMAMVALERRPQVQKLTGRVAEANQEERARRVHKN
ncbi:MAG TPA: hypothetical protein VEZ90_02675 [Blastocatellia bacterium]|nr:hypothetical protein [Blastocatellia bacterium]